MEPVTTAENLRRAVPHRVRKPKSHCVNGHEMTPENTIVTPLQRQCRTCRRAMWAKQNAKRASARRDH
jgi:hypothetical protein